MSSGKMGRVSWSVVLILSLCAFVVQAAEQKAKPDQHKDPVETPTTAQPPKSQERSDMMETVDYIRSGALLVAFLAINFAGRDTWLLAEVLSGFSFGIAAFFFPDAWLGYMTEGKLDAIHLCVDQLFGATLVGMAVTVYISKDSRDRGVTGSILMSRILGGAVLLQATLIDHMKAKGDAQRMSEAHLTFTGFGILLWVIGSFWQYIRGPSYGSSGVDLSDRYTKHLLLELLITLPAGLYMFAFPDHDLSFITLKNFKPDGIHAHLVRSYGAIFFTSGLHCLAAMGFSDNIDKRAHLLGRLVAYVMTIPTIALYQYKYASMPMDHFYFGLALQFLMALNSLCGYYIRGKPKSN